MNPCPKARVQSVMCLSWTKTPISYVSNKFGKGHAVTIFVFFPDLGYFLVVWKKFATSPFSQELAPCFCVKKLKRWEGLGCAPDACCFAFQNKYLFFHVYSDFLAFNIKPFFSDIITCITGHSRILCFFCLFVRRVLIGVVFNKFWSDNSSAEFVFFPNYC